MTTLKCGDTERGDAEAFIERGNALTDEYSPGMQQDPRRFLLAGTSSYHEALRFYSPEAAPLKYATTQNNLGTAYSDLAAHEEEKEKACSYLQEALNAYEKALRYFTPRTHLPNYKQVIENQARVKEMMQERGC